jgi:uncharacterized SAM-binding protein YcdF (DUF218 family)
MKQFVAPLAEPLGVIWLFMALGVLWLLWRRRWHSASWLGAFTLLIFVVGSTPLAEMIVTHLEAQAVVGESPEARGRNGGSETLAEGREESGTVVVVLGGGYCVSDRDPSGFALRDAGTRILAGLELLRADQASALVLGGTLPVPGSPGLPASPLLESWVLASGLARTATVITNLGICMNTHDEAVQFQKLEEAYRWRKVLLVTSALHMPRSVAVFKKQGIDVEPVACDFKVYGVPGARFQFSPFPRQSRFQILGLYLHEKIGWWVYRARGWV